MTLRLYFRNGITFQKSLAVLKDYCHYEPNPNGAPLGNEPTQLSYFDEAGCSGWGIFPGFENKERFSIGGASLRRDGLCDRALCALWNPDMDTLIHVLYLNFSDYLLFPDQHYKWEESQSFAPRIYKVYKDLFVRYKCDEAQALTEHLSVLLHWVRASNHQAVISDYEIGREMTLEQAQSWNWRSHRPTKEVFPEISDEYERAYKEKLDYVVDW
jgi:hypothetical protein